MENATLLRMGTWVNKDRQGETKVNAENAEKNLWEQIRSLTQLQLRICQWGVTTLVALQAALTFLRRELVEMLKLTPGQPLPASRHLIGTFVIFIVAAVFSWMSVFVSERARYYIKAMDQLPKEYPNDNVKVYPVVPRSGRAIGWLARSIFFFFPVFDLGVWFVRSLLYSSQ